jgi:hypothetical protein
VCITFNKFSSWKTFREYIYLKRNLFQPYIERREIRLFENLLKGCKYLLRVVIFIFYFPFYVLFQVGKYIIIYPCLWLWQTIIGPLGQFIWIHILKPVFLWVILYPLEKLWQFLILPILHFLWKRVIVSLWQYMLYPFFYYILYLPFHLFYVHILRPFYHEIIVPVLRFSKVVLKWIWKRICWIWLHLVWFPVQWIWKMLIWIPCRWVYYELIRPCIKTIRRLLSWWEKLFKKQQVNKNTFCFHH